MEIRGSYKARDIEPFIQNSPTSSQRLFREAIEKVIFFNGTAKGGGG